jgi:hypothetical protein
MLRKGKEFLLHMWYPSSYSCYNPGDKSWMRKGQDCDYDKWNIFVVICDTAAQYRLTKSWWGNFRNDDFTTRTSWLSGFLVSSRPWLGTYITMRRIKRANGISSLSCWYLDSQQQHIIKTLHIFVSTRKDHTLTQKMNDNKNMDSN